MIKKMSVQEIQDDVRARIRRALEKLACFSPQQVEEFTEAILFEVVDQEVDEPKDK